jgi:hypothetical protein
LQRYALAGKVFRHHFSNTAKKDFMKQLATVVLAALFFTQAAQAQESSYNNAVGIRLGPSVPTVKSGITFKHFLANNNAIEGILSFGDGVAICGMYEIHKPIAAENLQWFIGFGGYAGFANTVNNIGAAGIVGLDYNFSTVPLNITLDWKPELNLIERVGFEASTVGLSVRYRF